MNPSSLGENYSMSNVENVFIPPLNLSSKKN